jgi:hypothetical protein
MSDLDVKERFMIRPHQGEVFLNHNFATAFDSLSEHGKIELATDAGTQFSVTASQTRDGRKVIRFFQDGVEYARCYECCWGKYYNCNRTRIGMYVNALDHWLSR